MVAMDSNSKTIYVHLLEEGTEVLRPAPARQISELVYLMLLPEDYDDEDEIWAFPPGSLVRCVAEVRQGESILVATELLDA